MQFPPDVCICRSSAGINARHPAVTHSRKQHRNHGNKNRRDHMAMRFFADDAETWHRRGWLHYDDSVDDQVPESQCSPELTGLQGPVAGLCAGHSLVSALMRLTPKFGDQKFNLSPSCTMRGLCVPTTWPNVLLNKLVSISWKLVWLN